MRYCIHCGAELEEDAKFCTNCGSAVEENPGEGSLSSDSGKSAFQTDQPQRPRSSKEGVTGKTTNKALAVLVAALCIALVFIVYLLVRPSDSSQVTESSQQISEPNDAEQSATASGESSSQDSASSASDASSGKVSVRALPNFIGGAGTGSLTSYSASTVLTASEYGTYTASNLDDGAWDTAWVEGASGSGAGQSAKMSNPSGKKITVSEIELVAGYTKSKDIYYKNARPKQVSVVADTGEVVAQVTLSDSYQTVQSITFPAVSTSSLSLRIDSVYEGNKYDDCAISEMRCF